MGTILHVDLNAFYASVEQALDVNLAKKPIAVAGDPKKRNGIILTSSYEARKYGVKTAMTLWQVKQICPDIIFVQPQYSRYFEYSSKVINIIKDYSPLCEQFSIDEAWIDVTGCEKLLGSGVEIAYKIKERIKRELNITASVGVSYCKLMAKMASDLKKPDAVTVVNEDDVKSKIWPLSIKELIGVGRKIEPKLKCIGIYTIGDLANSSLPLLENMMGKYGRYLWYFANGKDNSKVNKLSYSENIKGVGNSTTTPKDLITTEEIMQTLLSLSESVGSRLRDRGYEGKVIEIQIKGSDFKSIIRQKTLNNYTNITMYIFATAKQLFQQNWDVSNPVRLLGVRVSNLKTSNSFKQLSMFSNVMDDKLEKIDYCLDGIRQKFGYNSIFRASLILNDTKMSYLNDEEWIPMKSFRR